MGIPFRSVRPQCDCRQTADGTQAQSESTHGVQSAVGSYTVAIRLSEQPTVAPGGEDAANRRSASLQHTLPRVHCTATLVSEDDGLRTCCNRR